MVHGPDHRPCSPLGLRFRVPGRPVRSRALSESSRGLAPSVLQAVGSPRSFCVWSERGTAPPSPRTRQPARRQPAENLKHAGGSVALRGGAPPSESVRVATRPVAPRRGRGGPSRDMTPSPGQGREPRDSRPVRRDSDESELVCVAARPAGRPGQPPGAARPAGPRRGPGADEGPALTLWSMVYGPWYMAYGLWSMVYGLWSIFYGADVGPGGGRNTTGAGGQDRPDTHLLASLS
jgi:hypothetical protein